MLMQVIFGEVLELGNCWKDMNALYVSALLVADLYYCIDHGSLVDGNGKYNNNFSRN